MHLTDQARALLPVIEAEWAVTEAAARELDAELPVPLGEVLDAILAATARRPFRQRLADAAAASADPAVRAVVAKQRPAAGVAQAT